MESGATILIERHTFTDTYTIGKMYIHGKYVCDTLEDAVRDTKIYGKTAIPTGTFPVKMTYSPHFKKILPELFDVPNYSYVRIHQGNTSTNTSGCILVGTYNGGSSISDSVIALNKVLALLQNESNIDIRICDFSQTAKTKPKSRLKPFLGFVTILVIIGLGYFIYTKIKFQS